MNDALWLAVLGVLPPVSAFAAGATRVWIPAVFAAAAAALGGWLAVQGPVDWAVVGATSALACGYAAFAVRRVAVKESVWREQIGARRRQTEEMAERLAKLRAEGSQGEKEQKKALAIYGIVKGLSEALDWETMRPKLEAAVHQQLGLDEFALYVSDMRFENTMHPLAKRRLVGSIGSSWDSLKAFLEEKKLSLQEPHQLAAPQNAVAVPIHHGKELVGYLFGRVPTRSKDEDMLEKAKEFGEEIAFALKRVRLFQEVERLSELDGLTGVYRRAIWDNRIKEEMLRAKTFKTGFCVLLMDIDHFKRLNDTYGHQFGDQVLRRVGAVLRESVYDTDFVARYGGEEFSILLPRANPEGVKVKANRIRENVEKESFAHGLETVKVTISIGVAAFPRDGQVPDEIVAEADRALYKAKASGRNCVIDVSEVGPGGAGEQ